MIIQEILFLLLLFIAVFSLLSLIIYKFSIDPGWWGRGDRDGPILDGGAVEAVEEGAPPVDHVRVLGLDEDRGDPVGAGDAEDRGLHVDPVAHVHVRGRGLAPLVGVVGGLHHVDVHERFCQLANELQNKLQFLVLAVLVASKPSVGRV